MPQKPRNLAAGLNRRDLLRLLGASGYSLALTGCGSESVSNETPQNTLPTGVSPFLHGVASGDPIADSVILWTRVTPIVEALPGSGLGGAVEVLWEISATPEFDSIEKSGKVLTDASSDHTVHINAEGLTPDQHYWYRFETLGVRSPVGHTRTAPATNQAVDAVRLGLLTCAEYEFGFFGACRHIAQRADLSAVLHMGDYIYEFGNSYGPIATPGEALGRQHQPPYDIVSLADYRTRYGQYRNDVDLQAAHAAHAFICIYDDHEVANDWWREGAENHDPSTQGDFFDRLAAGMQAWREWLPIRIPDLSEPQRVYRKLQYGTLVDLFLLDTRLYRDEQPTNAIVGYASVDPATDDPDRTLLGPEQREWLSAGLQSSNASWKVLGNQVPFYPFVVGTALPSLLTELLDPLDGTLPPLPAPLTVEDWNGYRADQSRMIEVMSQVDDVVILTGDYHESFAAEVPSNIGEYRLTRNSVAVEFICPAITSPGLSETLGGLGVPASDAIDTVFEANLTLGNPWVKYHEGFSNGYAVVEFNVQRTRYDYWYIDDRADPQTGVRVAASWQVERGSSLLSEASAPLAT